MNENGPECGYLEQEFSRLPEKDVYKRQMMDGALSLSKKGICHSENEKSGGGLPIGVCEDMCLANTPYRRKITETRVFPLFFKSRGGTGGDRGSKASITSRRDPASPSSRLSTFLTV